MARRAPALRPARRGESDPSRQNSTTHTTAGGGKRGQGERKDREVWKLTGEKSRCLCFFEYFEGHALPIQAAFSQLCARQEEQC